MKSQSLRCIILKYYMHIYNNVYIYMIYILGVNIKPLAKVSPSIRFGCYMFFVYIELSCRDDDCLKSCTGTHPNSGGFLIRYNLDLHNSRWFFQKNASSRGDSMRSILHTYLHTSHDSMVIFRTNICKKTQRWGGFQITIWPPGHAHFIFRQFSNLAHRFCESSDFVCSWVLQLHP